VKAERVLKLFPLACIQSSKVWIKAFIMAAVTFRWKQQLLGWLHSQGIIYCL